MIYVLSGGAGLNLKVVGGTSAPSSPKENTIWVNTATAINGYAFSATAPTSPVAGMVWFSVGADSTAPMNIDKKNTVMLYPVACKQYVGGAWVRKIAQTYLNGAWADWMLVIWDNGDNETATGGWTSQYFNSSGSADYSSGNVSVLNGTVTLTTNNSGSIGGQSYTTIDAIDITPYKTMKIYITDGVDNGYGYTSTAFFGVTTARTGTAQWTEKKAGTSIVPSTAKAQTFVTVDVTNVNEPCYILAAIEKGGGAVATYCSISFNKIELY